MHWLPITKATEEKGATSAVETLRKWANSSEFIYNTNNKACQDSQTHQPDLATNIGYGVQMSNAGHKALEFLEKEAFHKIQTKIRIILGSKSSCCGKAKRSYGLTIGRFLSMGSSNQSRWASLYSVCWDTGWRLRASDCGWPLRARQVNESWTFKRSPSPPRLAEDVSHALLPRKKKLSRNRTEILGELPSQKKFQSPAWTTSLLAFSSISINSMMYLDEWTSESHGVWLPAGLKKATQRLAKMLSRISTKPTAAEISNHYTPFCLVMLCSS